MPEAIDTESRSASVNCCTVTLFAWFQRLESYSMLSEFDAKLSPPPLIGQVVGQFCMVNHPIDENLVNSVDPYPAG